MKIIIAVLRVNECQVCGGPCVDLVVTRTLLHATHEISKRALVFICWIMECNLTKKKKIQNDMYYENFPSRSVLCFTYFISVAQGALLVSVVLTDAFRRKSMPGVRFLRLKRKVLV